MQSKIIGIREAKINLSKLVKIVLNGGEVILTDRGRPVVKMVPVKTEDRSLAERIKSLENRGLLEPKGLKLYNNEIPPPIRLPCEMAQRFLHEDRIDD